MGGPCVGKFSLVSTRDEWYIQVRIGDVRTPYVWFSFSQAGNRLDVVRHGALGLSCQRPRCRSQSSHCRFQLSHCRLQFSHCRPQSSPYRPQSSPSPHRFRSSPDLAYLHIGSPWSPVFSRPSRSHSSVQLLCNPCASAASALCTVPQGLLPGRKHRQELSGSPWRWKCRSRTRRCLQP